MKPKRKGRETKVASNIHILTTRLRIDQIERCVEIYRLGWAVILLERKMKIGKKSELLGIEISYLTYFLCRGSIHQNHSVEGCPFLASFSVFDGHNGVGAADTCAEYFSRSVATRAAHYYSSMMREETAAIKTKDPSSSSGKSTSMTMRTHIDAIVCESIRSSVRAINEKLLETYISGTTLNGLFFQFDMNNNSVRVYCANIGDSKSVMYKGTPPVRLKRGVRLSETLPIPENSIDGYMSFSSRRISSTSAVNALVMSEDHTLGMASERKRVTNNEEFVWRPLPIELESKFDIWSSVDKEEKRLKDAAKFIDGLVKEYPLPPEMGTIVIPTAFTYSHELATVHSNKIGTNPCVN